MSLTTGRGPLSPHPGGRFSGDVYVEPHPRRVRGIKAGEVVVDTQQALLVHRPGRSPHYAFPAGDVRTPSQPLPELDGYVEVAWESVDAWFEEDHQVIGHPRNPYHRVDCLPTGRRVTVEIAGTVIATTDQAIALFETGLGPRLYLPRSAVRMDLLTTSDTQTYCPYKGDASYWSCAETTDVAWSYEQPFNECAAIAGMLSFYADRCALSVDPPFETAPI